MTSEEAKAAGRKVGLAMFPTATRAEVSADVDPNPYAAPLPPSAATSEAAVLNLEGALSKSDSPSHSGKHEGGKFESPTKRRCSGRRSGGEVAEVDMEIPGVEASSPRATPGANAISPLVLSPAPTPLLDS